MRITYFKSCWLKRLFCKHNYTLRYGTPKPYEKRGIPFLDAILEGMIVNAVIERCTKCDKTRTATIT